MTITIGGRQVFTVLQVLSWIIFIGLCIETGGMLFNLVYACYKPIVAKHFWNGADLSALYAYDKGYFITQVVLMIIAAVMKTLIFFWIVQLFYDKQFSITTPFRPGVTKVALKIAYCCLGAGIFSLWGTRYAAWLNKLEIPMPDFEQLRIGGADVWLFMAVVLFVISQMLKKGTELQIESDLTV